MTDDMQPVVNVGKQLRKVATDEGLIMLKFVLQPNLDGDAHSAQAIFLIDEDAPIAISTGEADPEFEELLEGQLRAEQEQQTADARKRLEEMQNKLSDPGKGLGLDDD